VVLPREPGIPIALANDINPGNTMRGKIAFGMPVGDKAVKIEAHDSMFSNTVTVKLS
jgi:Domain of unknown function (DUF4352)